MFKYIAVLLPAALMAVSAFAVDPAIKKQLQKLDPEERLEQSCDTEAMKRIAQEKTGFRPDKVIAYTFHDPALGEELDQGARRRLPQRRRLVPSVLRLRDRPEAHERPLAQLRDRPKGAPRGVGGALSLRLKEREPTAAAPISAPATL